MKIQPVLNLVNRMGMFAGVSVVPEKTILNIGNGVGLTISGMSDTRQLLFFGDCSES